MIPKLLAAAAALLVTAGPGHSENNILFILDASNSMWGQVDGTAKIDTAKSVFGSLLGQIPQGTRLGLMAYGHRSQGDCADIELVAPVGAAPDTVRRTVEALTPRGKTPIAASLQKTWDAFSGREEENNAVVLISDGIETCQGDPCAVSQQLTRRGVKLRVHVVGFDVDEPARAQLQCIAEKGGGQYFPADSTAGFGDAVAEAVKVARQEPPPAAPPARSSVFFDDFDGDRLSEDWVVHNPEPNAHVVEGGNLLLLSTAVGGFGEGTTANIIELARDLPAGDWDARITFLGELKSGRDSVWFGLRSDHENFLAARIGTRLADQSCSNLELTLFQSSGGKVSQERTPLFGGKVLGRCGSLRSEEYAGAVKGFESKPAVLTFSKRGRSYSASVQVGGGETYWTQSLTSLRSPGRLALTVGKWERADGEVLILIDSVEVETVE